MRKNTSNFPSACLLSLYLDVGGGGNSEAPRHWRSVLVEREAILAQPCFPSKAFKPGVAALRQAGGALPSHTSH